VLLLPPTNTRKTSPPPPPSPNDVTQLTDLSSQFEIDGGRQADSMGAHTNL
jgi:hypothetical protein